MTMNNNIYIEQESDTFPSLLTPYFNPTIRQFETTLGNIAYTKFLNSSMTLVPTDPLCSKEKTKELLLLFLKEFPNSCFIHITKHTKDILEKISFKSKLLGQLHSINPNTFKLTWRTHRGLKGLINYAKKKDVKIMELNSQHHIKELIKVNKTWYKHKHYLNKNQNLLLMPNEHIFKKRNRIFAAYYKGKIIAYQAYLPIKNNKKIIYENIQARYIKSIPKGTIDLIQWEAIQKLKRERCEELRLGLSPNKNFSKWQKISHLFYNDQGAHEYKKRYHAEKENIYFSTQNNNIFLEQLSIFTMTLNWIKPTSKNFKNSHQEK